MSDIMFVFFLSQETQINLLFFYEKKHEINGRIIPLILLGGYSLEQHRW